MVPAVERGERIRSEREQPVGARGGEAGEDREAERPAHHERGVDDSRGEAGLALGHVAHGGEQHGVHGHAAADAEQRHAGEHVEGEAAVYRRQREQRESRGREREAGRERHADAEAHHHFG